MFRVISDKRGLTMKNSLSALCLASALLLLSACGPAADNSATSETATSPATTPVQNTAPTQASPAAPATPQTNASYLVYVTNEDSNNVSVIDGDTRTVLQSIDIGKRPRG